MTGFQELIDGHAPDEVTAAKDAARRILDEARTPDPAMLPETRAARTAFRVALRQWEHLNGVSETSIAWRALCDPTRGDNDEIEEHAGRG